jgi:hypothetical protein
MDGNHYGRMFLNAAYYLLVVFCLIDFRALVIGGLFDLIASLILAFLLTFVVVHSANVCAVLAACLRVLPSTLFPVPTGLQWAENSQSEVAVRTGPHRFSLLQRPPTISF